MKMAPRMIQSMEILQMPMLALQERVDQELESNVALEQVEPRSEDDAASADGEDERLAEGELNVAESPAATDDWRRLGEFEASYEEGLDNQYPSQRFSRSRMAGERDRKMDALANVAARGEGLTEQLLKQWSFDEVDERLDALDAIVRVGD